VQLTSTCSVADFEPPSPGSNLTPAVSSHERPCIETFCRCITNASCKQRGPCALRWGQEHFNLATPRCRQCHHGLDVFQVDDTGVRWTATTVAVQRHFQLTVYWDSSEHIINTCQQLMQYWLNITSNPPANSNRLAPTHVRFMFHWSTSSTQPHHPSMGRRD